MKVIFQNKDQEASIKLIKEENCYHEYLKTNKKTRDKVCVSCGRVIYLCSK
ncbi:MAG: hypothetical protein K0S53_2326 [Bacteroidetes bacterium]|jgi:hypothetical protein|nr:hypothetical protein [Bacteroidota bacterium]MDF2450575.1 hypothetical protein [Bacteroidota bacterium]